MNINQYRIQESRYESIFSYLDSYISYSHSKISHFLSEMCEVIFCVTTKNLAKFLLKIFFPVTISLDTEQTKKFHQKFLELKASTL